MKVIKVKKYQIKVFGLVSGACFILMLSGCNDPSAAGRFRATPVTNVILDSIGVMEEKPDAFAGARNPKTKDLVATPEEYVIEPGDILRITIFELDNLGVQREEQLIVGGTGRITLPVIGTMQATGFTELELTDEIVGKLQPHIIRDPKVSVVVLQSSSKSYTISGVAQPGRYPLSKPDFRIADAFADAGGIPLFNVDVAYVIRQVSDEDLEQQSMPPSEFPGGRLIPPLGSDSTFPDALPPGDSQEKKPSAEEELLESIAPMNLMGSFDVSATTTSTNAPLASDPLPITFLSEDQDASQSKPFKVVRGESGFELTGDEEATWIPEAPLSGPGGFTVDTDWGFDETGTAIPLQEVIRIDLGKLKSGDPQENIVIHPGDNIQVPPVASGIVYVTGQVRAPGPYQLSSGQKTTLKQAILGMAGPMTALAWPTRCELTRRIDDNQETTIPINLQMIMQGTAPDMFLKPGDIINVGSHPAAQWIAVIRSSFRTTYGFGFVYDRNFADVDFGR
jgi:protein involved in polysaccharide export with SLBB domain